MFSNKAIGTPILIKHYIHRGSSLSGFPYPRNTILHPGIGCCDGLVPRPVSTTFLLRNLTKEKLQQSVPKSHLWLTQSIMLGNGESPSLEAINPTGGRKTNTRDTRLMNITKAILKIKNWNAQGLNAQGNVDVLIDEVEQYQLDMVALITELHWPRQRRTRHKKWEIIHSGSDTNRREKTVGIMLSSTAAKSLLSYECVSERLMLARSNCTPTWPLWHTMRQHPKTRCPTCYRGYEWYNHLETSPWWTCWRSPEWNGIRLLTLCLAQNLVVGSSLLPHRKIHKLTWNSPDGKTVNQIDHTLVNRRWRNSLRDVRVYRGRM